MEIHGRAITFRFSTGAASELADLCPNGDLRKIPEMVGADSRMSEQNNFAGHLIAILSKWGDAERKYTEPGFVPNPMSFEEAMCLDLDTFTKCLTEALDQLSKDAETTVHTSPVPGKKGEEAEQRSS